MKNNLTKSERTIYLYPMHSGIYKITDRQTGQCYIGQSVNIEKRWKEHRFRFNPDLYDYEILMNCPVESLDFFERAFISGYDSCKNGLNRTLGGNGMFGFFNDEIRKKISSKIKGRRHTEESKAKMSESQKGKTFSDETRHKMSEAKKGRSLSEDHKKKISLSGIGMKRPEGTGAKISASKIGKPRSEETKRKIAETLRNKHGQI